MTEKRINFRKNRRVGVLEMQVWKRALAFILDILLVRLLIVPSIASVVALLVSFDKVDVVESHPADNLLIVYPINLIAYLLYFSLLESSSLQTTLGKRFFRLKVCDQTGERISFLRAFMRSITRKISIISIFGVLMIDVNKNRQALHDKVCNTFVRI